MNLGSAGFLLGCLVAVFIPSLPPRWILITIITVTLFSVLLYELLFTHKWQYLITVFCFALGFSYFCLRAQILLNNQLSLGVEHLAELQIEVVSFPKIGTRKLSFKAKINNINTPQATPFNIMGGNILLSCYDCKLNIAVGEQWQVTARLKRPRGAASWGVFDFERFALANNIVASGVMVDSSNAYRVSEAKTINSLRSNIKRTISAASISTHGKALITSMMIGDRSSFEPALWQFLKVTGLAHIVAISGLHVGLIFGFSVFFLRLMTNRICWIYQYCPAHILIPILALPLVYFYCQMVGFSLPTQRAFIMLLIYCMLRLSLYGATNLKVLLLTCLMMVLYKPIVLLSVSFWMSVLAVLIIGLALSGGSNHYARSKRSASTSTSKLWRLLYMQWRLSLGMAAVSLLLIGSTSIISPLVNMFVVPVVSLIVMPVLLLGLGLLMVEQLSLALWLLQALDQTGQWVFNYLHAVAWLDFVGLFELPIIGGFRKMGVALICLIWAVNTHLLGRGSLVMIACICLSLNTRDKLQAGEVLLTVLDVGQALAVVVELQGYQLIYDTGNRFENFDSAQSTILPYLRGKNISYLNKLIVSHHDSDHMGGMQSLLKSLVVNEVTSHGLPENLPIEFQARFSRCQAGQYWQEAGVEFQYLAPHRVSFNTDVVINKKRSENNRSCVLKITSPYADILLTGDIERTVEHELIKRYASSDAAQAKGLLVSDILVLAHHGSKTSSSPSFLNLVSPKLAISSTGYLNRHGHPHAKVLQRLKKRGIQHINTVNSGSVQIHLQSNGYEVARYRQKHQRFWYAEISSGLKQSQ